MTLVGSSSDSCVCFPAVSCESILPINNLCTISCLNSSLSLNNNSLSLCASLLLVVPEWLGLGLTFLQASILSDVPPATRSLFAALLVPLHALAFLFVQPLSSLAFLNSAFWLGLWFALASQWVSWLLVPA